MNPPAIQIENEVIPVTPSGDHEYTLPTALVAQGYGVNEATVRRHKQNHSDELVVGVHFIEVDNESTGVQNLNTRQSTGATNCSARQKGLKRGNDTVTHWTKLGVITLGFFIRSERAKIFRRAAAEMILSGMEREAALPGVDPVEANLLRRIEACAPGDLDTLERLVSIYRRATVPALPPAAKAPGKITPKLILDMIPPEGVEFADLGERIIEATGAPWAFFWQVWNEKLLRGKKSYCIEIRDGYVTRVRQ